MRHVVNLSGYNLTQENIAELVDATYLEIELSQVEKDSVLQLTADTNEMSISILKKDALTIARLIEHVCRLKDGNEAAVILSHDNPFQGLLETALHDKGITPIYIN